MFRHGGFTCATYRKITNSYNREIKCGRRFIPQLIEFVSGTGNNINQYSNWQQQNAKNPHKRQKWVVFLNLYQRNNANSVNYDNHGHRDV